MIGLAAALAGHLAAPPDFRRAWTCSSRGEFDGVTTSVIRTLDDQGRQLDVDVQWNVGTSRPFTAAVFAMAHAKGSGDPPLRSGTVLVSWTSRPAEGADSREPVTVLNAKTETPRRADGRARIDHSDTSFSVEVPWARVVALSRDAQPAQLSVLNVGGAVIDSSAVELRQVGRAIVLVEEALRETRWQMRDYKERCERVTEWVTL